MNEIKGTATVKVRNVTIKNVEVVKLATGEYHLPFTVRDIQFRTQPEIRQINQQDWYPNQSVL